MSKAIDIFIVQMTSCPQVDVNLAWVEQQLALAASCGAELVVLPEMFAQFGVADPRPLAAQERTFNGPVGSVIRTLAQQYGLWIVAGTVPVLTDADRRPRARCHVVNAQGEVVSHYDKIHLFDAVVGDQQGVYKESDSYSPGSEVVTVDSPWGILGLTVCYDLRFPELFRQLNDAGAELVLVPSAFTYKTGQAHWDILCRARAIENGYFIAAVNQCGQHDERRRTWGHSLLVDPWGETQDLGAEPSSRLLTVDFDRVAAVRQQLPVNRHRRLG
ncbi:carbon-nitrogen hydrolase family protein [Reinekea sp.]|jgi:nitrilase|uniref:carbon-nitrogen hydrolase family protein n=1 Tax=Reinekea sp. TaxID=1970455 RepID=UPI002A806D47|nr:carbon-nitrogen hydrolase family protein [Reinekea sp.]